jgi:hypothetical protein
MWTRKSNADFCMQSWQRLPSKGHHSTEWFGEKTAIPGIVSKKKSCSARIPDLESTSLRIQ